MDFWRAPGPGSGLEEVEEEALHAVRAGEVRPGVAIEELGDLLSLADDLNGLLGQNVAWCSCRRRRQSG
jgi:hypothetical protein